MSQTHWKLFIHLRYNLPTYRGSFKDYNYIMYYKPNNH